MHPVRSDSRLFRDALERLREASPAPVAADASEPAPVRAGEEFVSDRRETEPPRVIGRLVALNGTEGVLSCPLDTSEEDWSVGHLITIVHKTARIVGAVCDVETDDRRWSATEVNTARVRIELAGEIIDDSSGAPYFHRGVSSFPSLGAPAHRIRADDLRAIYAFRGREGVEIGRLSQNQAIPAEIDVGELIRRHFAVLGSTGVGKTTSVSLLLRKSVAMRPKLRVIIFDPHNEYAAHFPGLAQIIDSDSLELPFWMFQFDELADVVFSGRQPHADERDALYEVIRAAKAKYLVELGSPAATSAVRRQPMSEGVSVTADTPTPFRIIDVVAIIEDWLGMLDQRFPRSDLRALRYRLEGLNRDPRFRFMFGRLVVEDDIAKVISRLFRIPTRGLPVTIVRLAGLPNEVINSVVSVLARLAFEIAFWCSGTLRNQRAVRRGPPLYSSRKQANLRPGQAGDRPDRQGRAEVRRLARGRVATSLGARFHCVVAMFHPVRHEARQRARQGDHSRRGGRFGEQHGRLPVVDRRPRGDCIWRGHRHADADEVRRHIRAPGRSSRRRSGRARCGADRLEATGGATARRGGVGEGARSCGFANTIAHVEL